MSLQTSAQDSNRRQIKSLIDSGLAYRSSSSLKIIKEWKTVNYTSSFKLLSSIFTTVFTRNKAYILSIFKSIDSLYDSEDTPYDIIIIRKYSKLCRIIMERKQFILRIALEKIKDYSNLPLFIKNLPFLTNRILIKTLACHQKAKTFKKNLVSKTKQRKVYNGLKIRYLLSVCENYFSKKNISKALYDGFRHWYLRTTIKTLYILDSEMTPMVRKRVGVGANTLNLLVLRKKKSIFWELMTGQFYKWTLNRNLRKRQEILKLIEVMNTVFARLMKNNQIYHLPFNGDSLKLSYYSQAFERIKNCKRYKYNKKIVKGANLIADIFRYRKLSAYHSFFQIPNRSKSQNKSIKYDDPATMGADKIFWTIYKNLKMIKLYFFNRTKCNAEALNIKSLQKKCMLKLTIRNLNIKKSQMQKAFSKWKTASQKFQKSQYAFHIMYSCVSDFHHKTLSKSFSLIKNYINMGKIISDQSSKIVKYHEMHAAKSAEIAKAIKLSKLASVILADNKRYSYNQSSVGKFFRRWLSQTPFSNSKLNEYHQLLDILESEINYLHEEISEIQQEAQSPLGITENKINSKMRYLEFLEIQNSEVIELLEGIDVVRDGETREIELELLGRPKRSYSM